MCVAMGKFFLAVILCGLLLWPLTSWATDEDGNGFDDAVEQVLAQRFCPSFRLQEGQHVRPMPVGIIGTSNSFTSVQGNAVWVKMYGNVQGQVIGAWRADDPGWSGPWINLGYGGPNWNYSWVHDVRQYWEVPGKAPGIYTAKFYLDWGGPSTDAPPDWGPLYLSSDGNSYGHPGRYYKSATYAHLFWADTLPVIQYWFFYPYDDWVNNHEGDWEHINVVISSADPQQSCIERVEYHFHNHYVSTDPTLGQLYQVEGTHPVVFVGGYGEMYCGVFIGSGSQSGGSYPVFGHWERVGSPVQETVLGVTITCPGAAEDLSSTGDYVHWSDVHVVVWPHADSAYCAIHPDRSWMKAKMPWGTVRASSPGDWTGVDSIGNDAPVTPSRGGDWEHLGPETAKTLYCRPRPHDPVTDSGWLPPQGPTAPQVTVVRPNTAGTWYIGTTPTILWTTSSPIPIDSVDILLSLDGGSTFPVTISHGHDDVWSLPWTVGVSPCTHCRVKVVAHVADGSTTEDVSDVSFTIDYTPPPPPPPDPGTPSGCPFVSVWNGGSFGEHNTVLNELGTEASGDDRIDYLLFEKAKPNAGAWELEISEFEGDSVLVDQVRAYEVHTTAKYDGLVCDKGGVIGYRKAGDLGLLGGGWAGSSEVEVKGNAGVQVDGTPGTTTLYQLHQKATPGKFSDPYLLIVGEKKNTIVMPPDGGGFSPMPPAGRTGVWSSGVEVSIQASDKDFGTPLGSFVPRENTYPFLIGPLPASVAADSADSTLMASLDFRGAHRVTGVSLVETSPDGISIEETRLARATYGDAADVTEQLRSANSRYVSLISSGHVRLSFAASASSMAADGLLLEIHGRYTSGPRHGDGGRSQGTDGQSLRILNTTPNPSSGEFVVSYQAWPQEKIELSVFDVRGRLVGTLFGGVAGAGVQTAVWDGKNLRGKTVAGGVYFVRLSCGHGACFSKLLLCR